MRNYQGRGDSHQDFRSILEVAVIVILASRLQYIDQRILQVSSMLLQYKLY